MALSAGLRGGCDSPEPRLTALSGWPIECLHKTRGTAMAFFLLSCRDMFPLPKTWLALLLVLPGGFIAALVLWLAFRVQQRRKPAPAPAVSAPAAPAPPPAAVP